MRLSRKNTRESFAIDLTTCSDIIFTLLIFYILTQSFVTQVPLNLPQLKSETQTLSEMPLQIEISATGQISFNKTILPPDWEIALSEKLKGIATDSIFLILANRQAPVGTAIELLDRLRLAGISNVSFGGMPQKNDPSSGTDQ